MKKSMVMRTMMKMIKTKTNLLSIKGPINHQKSRYNRSQAIKKAQNSQVKLHQVTHRDLVIKIRFKVANSRFDLNNAFASQLSAKMARIKVRIKKVTSKAAIWWAFRMKDGKLFISVKKACLSNIMSMQWPSAKALIFRQRWRWSVASIIKARHLPWSKKIRVSPVSKTQIVKVLIPQLTQIDQLNRNLQRMESKVLDQNVRHKYSNERYRLCPIIKWL